VQTPIREASPEPATRPRPSTAAGLKARGKTLVMFALTASFALLGWASYAESTGLQASRPQLAPAVHAPR